jgi:hypothetical protein
MHVYSERVEMISPGRRVVLFATALGVAGCLVYLLQDAGARLHAAAVLWKHVHLVLLMIAAATLAMTNEMNVELTNEVLLVRSAPHQRSYYLKEVSSARALSALKQPTWWNSWLGVDSNGSETIRTGVQSSVFGGMTIDVSSNNPDHLHP